jgi:hypothetical protein
MLVKPGLRHRGIGHGLDIIEPLSKGPLFLVGIIPFFLLSPPIGGFLQPLDSIDIGHEGAELAGGPEIR